MIIKINTPNINVNTFEDVFYKINLALLSTNKQDNISIDISDADFLDPYSIINLCILLRHIKKYFPGISLCLPEDLNVNSYLERMNLFHNIPQGIKLPGKTNASRPLRKFSSSDVLLEITPIQKQDDVHNIIDYSITKIGRILETSLGYTQADIASFCTALSETCQNIIDHSRDQGFVSVQKYHKDTNYVIIAVSDLGIGIKRSLANRYDVRLWNYTDAIQNALKLGISRFHDRGKGLYRVIEIVKKYRGKLIMRSGSGRAEIGDISRFLTVPYFPGTQIYIKL